MTHTVLLPNSRLHNLIKRTSIIWYTLEFATKKEEIRLGSKGSILTQSDENIIFSVTGVPDRSSAEILSL